MQSTATKGIRPLDTTTWDFNFYMSIIDCQLQAKFLAKKHLKPCEDDF